MTGAGRAPSIRIEPSPDGRGRPSIGRTREAWMRNEPLAGRERAR